MVPKTWVLVTVCLCSLIGHATSIVLIVAENGSYVAIAADSRGEQKIGGLVNTRCKLIQLGDNTLFYEAGSASIELTDGDSWDSAKVARTVYRNSQNGDTLALANAWGNEALEWFQTVSPVSLLSLAPHVQGVGFISFTKDRNPVSGSRILDLCRKVVEAFGTTRNRLFGQEAQKIVC